MASAYSKASLAREALKNLSSIARPNSISFPDMNALMRQCQRLDTTSKGGAAPQLAEKRRLEDSPDPTSLLSGILPGREVRDAGWSAAAVQCNRRALVDPTREDSHVLSRRDQMVRNG